MFTGIWGHRLNLGNYFVILREVKSPAEIMESISFQQVAKAYLAIN